MSFRRSIANFSASVAGGPTLPNVKSFQDMPPPGGYPRSDTTRGVKAKRGPSGLVIWTTIIGMSIFGFYQIGQTNQTRRHDKREMRQTRMAVASYLMFEHDKAILPEIKRIEQLQKDHGVYRPPLNPRNWRHPNPEIWEDL